jgi:uncharacterized protein (TIGR00369 family)
MWNCEFSEMEGCMPNDDPDFVSRWRESWSEVTADIAITLGIEPVSASDDHVELAMPFRPEIGQFTGLFSAGALIQLADVAATSLCLRTVQQRDTRGGTFPLSVQMSVQLVGNTNSGRAIARSTLISAGKTVMAAQTLVRDENGKSLILLASTHVIKAVRN